MTFVIPFEAVENPKRKSVAMGDFDFGGPDGV